ncbi:DUF2786 domain-containing protein [Streptomyces paludis]|uniref:DUF2786 domain-containing protein n=1 Tax=Streptomyces paludis TaxID=2282738 RepID=A0A345HX65_9ACTN|nr:DUF2786 domain-containing protein [Streptomyces paludis]
MVARIAAAEAGVRPPDETLGELTRIITPRERDRRALPDTLDDVREGLRSNELPVLRSWHAESVESLLLAEWFHERAGSVGAARAESELMYRWGLSEPGEAVTRAVERAVQDHGLGTLAEFFGEPDRDDPTRIFSEGFFGQSYLAERMRDRTLRAGEILETAGHLTQLAEQRSWVKEFEEWIEDQQQWAEAPHAEQFLEHIGTVLEAYSADVLDPVLDALSAVERGLVERVHDPEADIAELYLAEFLDGPAVDEEQPSGNGLSWRGMRGSLPVWFHVVTTPQERAAALAFTGVAAPPVVHIETDAPGAEEPFQFPFDFGENEPDVLPGVLDAGEWYPEPGIRLGYGRDDVVALCELLVLGQLGYARLEFLIRDASGALRVLRTVRAELPAGRGRVLAYAALRALSRLVSSPEQLASKLTGAYEELDDEYGDEGSDEYGEECEGGSGGEGLAHGGEAEGDSGAGTGAGAGVERRDGQAEDLLNKVRSLLRKGEDEGATKEEAETYLKKAAELMAKYGIEQAMLHADRPDSDHPADQLVVVADPYARQSQRLLSLIAFALRCQSVYLDRKTPGTGRVVRRVHIFGFASDLRRVTVLYAGLRLQMLHGAERADKVFRRPDENSKAYKRSWMYGFMAEVRVRIEEAERAARGDAERERQAEESSDQRPAGRSVALVLADRTTVVEARIAETYPKIKKAGKIRFQGTGYRQGRTDGQRADIGGPTVADADIPVPLL